MATRFATSLGHLELELMNLLWEASPQTGRDIVATLNMRRKVAYTTVGTTLDRLYQRGLLTREAQTSGQGMAPWGYRPRYTRQQLLCAAIAQLAENLGADEVERQYAATELRHGRLAA